MRKSIIPIAALTMFAFTACQPVPASIDQIVHVDEAASSEGTLSVVATCEGYEITTAGWPEGTYTYFGATPAWIMNPTLNATVTLAITSTMAQEGWNLMVETPDGEQQQIVGSMDCSTQADRPAQEIYISQGYDAPFDARAGDTVIVIIEPDATGVQEYCDNRGGELWRNPATDILLCWNVDF